MSPRVDLFLIAGEPSGDLQGAKLIQELFKHSPNIQLAGVAGPRMRTQHIDACFAMESLQVMGFMDVVLALPKIIRQFFTIRKKILELNPKGVVCIDYPGFNLRLERSLRKRGYRGKLIHFVCPTVWAWGKKRISLMSQNLDLLLSLLPFEKSCFETTSLAVEYVGHPLTTAIPGGLNSSRGRVLGLFPGSRTTEIERNFPFQLKIAQKLQTSDPSLQIAVSISHTHHESLIRSLAQNVPIFFFSPDQNYTLMRSARLALATSGTVTLELALHNTPTVVNFAIRPLDLFLAQKIFHIKLPFYSLTNIIASKEIFPEFFGPNLQESPVFAAAQSLWFDEKRRNGCLQGCDEVRKLLGERDASQEAARQILHMILL